MSEPAAIKKLDEAVINRIAAGEVIQRPANALKEMIENSIDAKANNIQVNVKDGGLKLLQIIDNGTGIRKEDFVIVCERFTTSKLEKFEDLNSISTYGFRGEALASISHVAHLTIQSKTINQDCAYKASYEDSQLKDSPKPCAGNQGTIITVEDLFYNMTTRKKALKNTTDEFRKISEVVNKYAIHNATVSFGLKKTGENATIKTPHNSNHIDNIRIIYGDTIAKELISFDYNDDNLKFSAMGYMTNVNYSTKKGTFILFINHRLVESASLKKIIDHVYSTYLPKNMYPFMYLSLQIDPRNVDVNVHPTKSEVHFLHEEQIIEKLVKKLEEKLLGSNNSRVFYTQAKLPGITKEKIELSDEKNKVKPVYDKNLVRTDSTDQKLDKFLCSTKNDAAESNKTMLNMTLSQSTVSNKVEIKLTSVLQLRKNVEDNCHTLLRELLSQHVFVGCVDTARSLIQHNTKLYLCRTDKIMRELFYQMILYNFQNLGTITFSKPLSLKQLTLIALDLPEVGWTAEEGSKTDLAEQVVKILMHKAVMLKEYFSVTIDADENLVTIPLLIENHTPEMAGLPVYVLRLATEVNWNKEKDCFDTFAKETAYYYAHIEENNTIENGNWKWTTEHIFYPTIKKYFLPPKSFIDNATILQIADLPNLYKVFERC